VLKGLLLSTLLSLPAQAQTVGAPVSPERTRALFEPLFDGGAVRVSLDEQLGTRPKKQILYSETTEALPAPRFALDLSAVPERYRNTVPGFDQLAHKNQEETPQQVDRINAMIRQRNQGRLFKIPEWTYDGRPNEPIWNCLSHAAATANDWWSLQLGRNLPTHENISHGGTDTGLDPYLLELEYFKRSKQAQDPDFVVPPKLLQKDPVRNSGFPYEPRGYAKLLTQGKAYKVTDPISGKVYEFKPEMSAMEGKWKQLFTNSVFRGKTPDKYAKVLAEGLDKWGIAYVQLEHSERPRWPGAHAVAVVGYFCMEPGEKLIDCSVNKTDADWGRTAWFIAHDTFGDFPASQPRTANSAAAYRGVRIGSVDQAIVFPHGLRVTLTPKAGVPGVWTVSVANNGGQTVPVSSIKALSSQDAEVAVETDHDGSRMIRGASGDALRIYVEAPHYFAEDGQGRGFVTELGEEARVAVPLERPSPK